MSGASERRAEEIVEGLKEKIWQIEREIANFKSHEKVDNQTLLELEQQLKSLKSELIQAMSSRSY